LKDCKPSNSCAVAAREFDFIGFITVHFKNGTDRVEVDASIVISTRGEFYDGVGLEGHPVFLAQGANPANGVASFKMPLLSKIQPVKSSSSLTSIIMVNRCP